MSPRDGKAAEMFNCTERERVFFEAGIKMGTVYHQFVGTPVSASNVKELESAIERSVMVQPFAESAKIRINFGRDGKKDTYDYVSLAGEMIDAVIVINMNGIRVKAEMRYVEELDYPLMYVSEASL